MAKFKVGDKLIYGEGEWYEAGTVVTVLEVDSDDEEMPYLVSDGEYDYWVEAYSVSGKPTKNQRISTLEQQVETLTRRIEALEQGTSYTHTPRPSVEVVKPLTPNQQRKSIIDEAKEFVEDVTLRMKQYGHGNKLGKHGEITTDARGWILKAEFVVNPEKRTVVALLRLYYKNDIVVKGIAKCAPDDVFNADIGKAIALGRALGLDVTRFEQAVKPTEVVVGMVVDNTFEHARLFGWGIGKVSKTDYEGYRVTDNSWSFKKSVVILDDTEAQYD